MSLTIHLLLSLILISVFLAFLPPLSWCLPSLSPLWHLRTRETLQSSHLKTSPTAVSFISLKTKITNAKKHNLGKCHGAWKMPTSKSSDNSQLIPEEGMTVHTSVQPCTHICTHVHRLGFQSEQRGKSLTNSIQWSDLSHRDSPPAGKHAKSAHFLISAGCTDPRNLASAQDANPSASLVRLSSFSFLVCF